MTPTAERVPLPRYANGWFQVAYSSELGPGDVRPLKYFGKDLVLFRTEAGEAKVLDAHCPHLGAHLGHGGKVVGDAVVCPFHAWEFNGEGRCTSVPYASKIPPKAHTLKPWPVRDINGLIMVWHHTEGEPPSWEVPVVPEYADEGWMDYQIKDWKIRTHNQEMAENALDTAHFKYLHGTSNNPEASAELRGHLLHVESTTGMKTPRGGVDGKVTVDAYGFGFTTTRFTGLVETLLVASVTTIDEEWVHLRFAFTVRLLPNAAGTSNVAKAFMREVTRQVEQDMPVWENKIYTTRPVLCDGDGPIGLYRRWCKQFYSEPVHEEPDEQSAAA